MLKRKVIAANLWSRIDFRNLSVEVLAYIYENTLVDAVSRKNEHPQYAAQYRSLYRPSSAI